MCLCGEVDGVDPKDMAYRPTYDNSDDSNDFAYARGYSYHNGPEWVWLTGYYLRAQLRFAADRAAAVAEGLQTLDRLLAHVSSTQWMGLPELTNADGVYCPFSCPLQAWSQATALEAAREIWECMPRT